MTGTNIGNAFVLNGPKPLDGRAGKFVGGRSIPWATKAEFFAAFPTQRSEIGTPIAIGDIDAGWEYYDLKHAVTFPTGGDSSDGWDLVPSQGVIHTLTGTTLEPNKYSKNYQSISANTNYTISGGTAGISHVILFVKNTGSFVVTIDGDTIPTRDSGTAGGLTSIVCWKMPDGTWLKESGYTPSSGGADTTAPDITDAEAVDGETINVTYSENIDAATTDAGYSVTVDSGSGPGSPISATGMSGTGSTRALTFPSSSFAAGDIIKLSYNAGPGDTQDTATTPNAMATVTDFDVTNSIVGAELFGDFGFDAGFGTGSNDWVVTFPSSGPFPIMSGSKVDFTGTSAGGVIDQAISLPAGNYQLSIDYDAGSSGNAQLAAIPSGFTWTDTPNPHGNFIPVGITRTFSMSGSGTVNFRFSAANTIIMTAIHLTV